MGSLDQARITGFLCRLCSEMHKIVIHLYGEEGLRTGLAEKINTLLPLTITPLDPLPKTICKTCLKRVEEFHQLVKTLTKTNEKLANAAATRVSALARLNSGSSARVSIRSRGDIEPSTTSTTNTSETATATVSRAPSIAAESSSVVTRRQCLRNHLQNNLNVPATSNSITIDNSINPQDDQVVDNDDGDDDDDEEVDDHIEESVDDRNLIIESENTDSN